VQPQPTQRGGLAGPLPRGSRVQSAASGLEAADGRAGAAGQCAMSVCRAVKAAWRLNSEACYAQGWQGLQARAGVVILAALLGLGPGGRPRVILRRLTATRPGRRTRWRDDAALSI